jgi:predicted RNA-binding Zn-ribbon protein involved in translation (DUF1610 family)
LEKTGVIVELEQFGYVAERIATCCGNPMPIWLTPRFCPHCGAKIERIIRLRRKENAYK